MKQHRQLFSSLAATLVLGSLLCGQQASPSTPVVVPRLLNFSGHMATIDSSRSVSKVVGITFAIYSQSWLNHTEVVTSANQRVVSRFLDYLRVEKGLAPLTRLPALMPG